MNAVTRCRDSEGGKKWSVAMGFGEHAFFFLCAGSRRRPGRVHAAHNKHVAHQDMRIHANKMKMHENDRLTLGVVFFVVPAVASSFWLCLFMSVSRVVPVRLNPAPFESSADWEAVRGVHLTAAPVCSWTLTEKPNC